MNGWNPDQKIDRHLEIKKKYRTIEQESLICSYHSPDQYQFDIVKSKERDLDEFELNYLRENNKKQKVEHQQP